MRFPKSTAADQKLEENQRGLMQRSFEYIFECLEKERRKAESSGDSY
jgi:hypothetical protein